MPLISAAAADIAHKNSLAFLVDKDEHIIVDMSIPLVPPLGGWLDNLQATIGIITQSINGDNENGYETMSF